MYYNLNLHHAKYNSSGPLNVFSMLLPSRPQGENVLCIEKLQECKMQMAVWNMGKIFLWQMACRPCTFPPLTFEQSIQINQSTYTHTFRDVSALVSQRVSPQKTIAHAHSSEHCSPPEQWTFWSVTALSILLVFPAFGRENISDLFSISFCS